MWRPIVRDLVLTGLGASLFTFFFHFDAYIWASCLGIALGFVADELIQARQRVLRK
jgi:hypothetical protein